MKYFLLLMFFGSIQAFAQYNSSSLQYNDVNAMVNDGGVLFQDPNNVFPGYEIPQGTGNHSIFSSSFWFGGIDQNSQLHLSGTRFTPEEDLFPGPIADSGMYTSAGYLAEYSNCMWTVLQVDINNHMMNWNQPGYTVPTSIATWPGNGDPSIGVAEQLAPYFDVNNNGIYEPQLGDYPNIRGDAATYVIMNDAAKVHTSSGGDQLGIEVHLMIYQFATNDYKNRTTFINARVFNRGTIDYSEFRTSYWLDCDLGSGSDDYVGSDSLRHMIYTYNGGAIDPNYGADPPAIGVVNLNQSMSGAGYFTNAAPSTQSDPSTAAGFWNYMTNKWRFGDAWVAGGSGFPGSTGSTTAPTNYLFSGDPSVSGEWSEISSSNPPGDRRMFMNLELGSLSPGDKVCYDFAVVFGQGNAPTGSVTDLKSTADLVQTFFDSEAYTCETVTVGMEELSVIEATVYPNPSSGKLSILLAQPHDELALEIVDVSGRLVYQSNLENQTRIELDLSNLKGVYFIKINSADGIFTERIILN